MPMIEVDEVEIQHLRSAVSAAQSRIMQLESDLTKANVREASTMIKYQDALIEISNLKKIIKVTGG